MSDGQHDTAFALPRGIDHSSEAPPVAIPPGHVGEFVIPGTGRLVWWTGRVAIGLLHRPLRTVEPMAQSALWIQDLVLTRPRAGAPAR